MRDRFRADPTFRSQVNYAVEHGIPYSVFLGRVIEGGEPEWLPEDRDIVAVVDEFERAQCAYGHWQWQWDDLENLDIDYEVCPICQAIGEASERVQATRKNMHGVGFNFYPPKED